MVLALDGISITKFQYIIYFLKGKFIVKNIDYDCPFSYIDIKFILIYDDYYYKFNNFSVGDGNIEYHKGKSSYCQMFQTIERIQDRCMENIFCVVFHFIYNNFVNCNNIIYDFK